MIQLAVVTCLSLAAKVEETQVPLLSDLQVEDSEYVFEAKTNSENGFSGALNASIKDEPSHPTLLHWSHHEEVSLLYPLASPSFIAILLPADG